jgi:HK97 gp10 family phage protein
MPNQLSDREYQEIMNSPAVQRVLDERADGIQAETKRRVAVRSGKARDSVAVVAAARDDGVRVRRIGYDLDVSDHGPYWEFGTEDTPPHPTLRTAAKRAR